MVSLAIAVNLLPVFFTSLSDSLGSLSHEQLGRIPAVTFAGLVAAILISGPLADRYGLKPFAIAGNGLVAGGLLLLGTAPAYPQVLLACFIMGFGAGTLDMVLSPIVCVFQPANKSSAMNWLHSFYCVGAVLTILIASLALQHRVSWRSAAMGLVAMPLLVGMTFFRLRMPAAGTAPASAGDDKNTLSILLRQRPFLWTLAAIFLGGATELGMAQWLPAYAEHSLGFVKWAADLAFLGFSLAMAVGRWGAGLIGHRVAPVTLLMYCCGASMVCFLTASFCPVPAVALAACILAGLAGSCLWPTTLAIAADRYPHGGATMFGLLAALGNFGGVLMPWLVGAVADALTVPGGGERAAIPTPLSWGLATAAFCPLLMMAVLRPLRSSAAPISTPPHGS